MTGDDRKSTDWVQLVGVVGLSVVAFTILIMSGVLALRGVAVPGAWETLAGAAVGSLGTLVVTRRSGSSTASIEAAHQAAVATQIKQSTTLATPAPTPPAGPMAPPWLGPDGEKRD